MYLLGQSAKLICSTFVCICFLTFINETAVAADGCRYLGQVYYTRTSNPPNPSFEYYTNESWIQFSSAISCNSSVNATISYVLADEVTLRAPKGGFCLVYSGTSYLIGKGVSFPRTYQCPLDEDIPCLLFLMFPVFFMYARRAAFKAVK